MRHLSAAALGAMAVFIASTPQITTAKPAAHAGQTKIAGKFGPITPDDLQGAYQQIGERNLDPKTKKWVVTKTVGVWSACLTRTAPGCYQFPGFNDILHGTTKTCSGVLTDAAMAVTGGTGKHPKPKPNPVRFVIKGVIMTEYQKPADNRRFIFKKVADDPKVWNRL